jgi:L-seryl-tRNA(Ser) seleniumtransferase
VTEAGLAGQVEIRLADYRELDGEPFDAVASIGMVEHVGARQIDAYAARLAELLRRGGVPAEAVETDATVGGGGAPGVALPSAAVALPESFAAALRAGEPAVLGRLERGRCLLDLRALPADADDTLAAAVLTCRS